MHFPGISILCIEDHKDTCDLLPVMLESHNPDYKMISAVNAEQALTLIEERSFALYILDCKLLDMDGMELCRRIRQTDDRTPIIFFTGRAQESDQRKAMEAGANAYLVKAKDIDRLIDTIDYLLQAE